MRSTHLLGSLLVVALAAGCGSDGGTPAAETPIDATGQVSLSADSQALTRNLVSYQATEGKYPLATPEQVASMTQTPLSPGTVVHTYVLTGVGPVFCLTNPTTGDWVRVDVASGATLEATPGSPLCGEPTPT